MRYTPAEINAAQLELDRYPFPNPFWDTEEGLAVLQIAIHHRLQPSKPQSEIVAAMRRALGHSLNENGRRVRAARTAGRG